MSQREPIEPSVFVIFGGTGDLSRRKLLPALCRAAAAGQLHERTQILGVARDQSHDDESFRALALEALAAAQVPKEAVARFERARLHYQTIKEEGAEDFRALYARLEALEASHDLPGNRAYYLALPPAASASTIEQLGAAGLNKSRGWTRLVIEKPFGKDLRTARELNELVHRRFDEKQIYRIDHYLGKETVQNLLVFRFANAIFESVWNRDRVQAVQITVAEDLGVGSRAGYYDRSGALRDMVQNHLTQLLTLVAMEVPSAFAADSIRYEKVKVLRSIAPINPENVVYGQYTRGKIGDREVPGYLDEAGVPRDTRTETFVAMKVEVDSWRWNGVPFFLRTGKRLPRRATQIAVRFRSAPVCLFQSMNACIVSSNLLVITVQPDEGFSLHFDVKVPGEPFDLRRIPLSFRYSDLYEELPEAYQTLLIDVLSGDQTLFVHSEEVEDSWQLYTPLLEDRPTPRAYAAGTWGPEEANHLRVQERVLWP